MLRPLAADLWVVDRPLRFAGLSLGTRMTVVRLADGALLLHSPVALDAALREALLQLGAPRYAIAPNRFHHLFIGEYRAAFPGIALCAAPGLPKKRKDLQFDQVLGDEAPAAWAGQLDQLVFAGAPTIGEVVFHHRASRSLLTCDLAFNIGPEAPWATRQAFRLAGCYGRLGPTRMEKLFIRDRAAARASLERVLDWDFERVVVAHGVVHEGGGAGTLRQSYRWLLEG
jgi:Domain of unknown function (DUF4336)